MSIDKIGSNPIQNYVSKTQAADQQGKAAKSDAARSRKADEVALSPDAQMLQKALQVVQATPDVRADRVAELRQQIQEGNYTIDPGLIAEKLLSAGES